MVNHGLFYWNELMTTDVEKTKAFYAKTLGWTYEDMDMDEGPYTIIKHGEDLVGGMMALPPEDAEQGGMSYWFSYVSVDDVDKRIAAVAAAGGNVLREPFDVQGVGRIGIVEDPSGAAIGWMTPADLDGEATA